MAENKKRRDPLDRDWRGDGQPQSPISRWVTRVLYSLFLLVLVGALCWLTILSFRPHKALWFAPLVVNGYPIGDLPPIWSQQANEEAIKEVCSEKRTLSLSGRNDRENIEDIAASLDHRDLNSSDTLLFYLSAHCISSQRRVHVLCSDYSEVGGLDQAYPLQELLEQISRLDVASKIVVIDPGRLSCDPRLGILVNEFSRLLPEELRRLQGNDLWLLAASGSPELPYTGSTDAQRHLARQIADGLQGAADENDDHLVTLAELFKCVNGPFVSEGASSYVQLLSGTTAKPEDVFLCRPSRQSPPPSIEAETPPDVGEQRPPDTTKQDPAGDRKLDGEKRTADGAQDEPERKAALEKADPETPPEGETEAKTPPESEQQKARKAAWAALRAAWQAHDAAIRGSGDDPRWSPIDCEPHLWRELEQRLLGYEQRCLAATSLAFPTEELDGLSGEIENKWGALPPAESDDGLGLLALRQQKNALVYHARDYLRWHAVASRYADTKSAFDDILELLKELQVVLTQFDGLEVKCQGSATQREDVEQIAGEISDNLKNLQDREARIKRRFELNPQEPLDRWQLEAVLSTSRVPYDDRMKLLKKLDELETVALGTLPVKDMWPAVHDQATLEVEFIKLGGENGVLGNGIGKEEILDLEGVKPNGNNNTERYWTVYRKLGAHLQCYYESLAERIAVDPASGSSSTQPAKVCKAERLLRILDPRDAENVDKEVARKITIRSIKPPERIIPILAIEEQGPVKLKSDGTTELVVSIICKDLKLPKGTARISIDPPDALVVSDERGRIDLSKRLELPLSSPRVPLALFLKPTPSQRGNLGTVELKVSVESGEQRGVETFVLKPDWVNLIVKTHEDQPLAAEIDKNNDQTFEIRPFPNRETPFYLSLANCSQDSRTVSLQIVSFPDRQENTEELRKSLRKGIEPIDFVKQDVDVQGKRFRLIETPLPVKLNARDPANPAQPHLLEAFEAPPEAESSEQPATKKPDQADAPTGFPASRNLAVVIRDHDSNEVWLNWLEIKPYQPGDFIKYQPKIVGDSRIEAHFALSKLPPKIADEPVVVEWKHYFGQESYLKSVRKSCELTETGTTHVLEAELDDPTKEVFFHFQVGGYPRAFLTRYRNGECTEQRKSLGKIRILSPQPGEFFRNPLQNKLVYADLAVDAPGWMPNPEAEVRIYVEPLKSRANLEPDPDRVFLEDRQSDIRLALGTAGELGIRADVDNFHVPLEKLKSFGEGKVRIRAELLLPGGDQTAQSRRDEVEIQLDGTPPELIANKGTVYWTPSPGEELTLTATATDKDGSGILNVVFGIDTGSDGRVDDPQDFLPPIPTSGAENDEYSCIVPEDKRPGPGRYRVEVVATDRVENKSRHKFYLQVQKGPTHSEIEAMKPTSGTIRGTVLSSSGKLTEGIAVELDGAALEQKTGSDGAFEFVDVPFGKYKLKAQGRIHGFLVSSDEMEVELSEENNEVEKTIRLK